jgi:peptidoglycan/LPS O-acetylase OafA/YrhL
VLKTSTEHYVPALDGIRCLGVGLVLLIHGYYGYFPGGWIGVDLFFVLSGYLITTLIEREHRPGGRFSFRGFYRRRAFRLFPPLILSLLLANALWTYTADDVETPDRLLATLSGLFYVANLVSPTYMGTLGPLWSLSVEEHFYLVWPLVMVGFLGKLSVKGRALVLIISLIGVSLFRIYIFGLARPVGFGPFLLDPYRFTLCRIDSVLLGAGVALLFPRLQPGTLGQMGQHTLLAALLLPLGWIVGTVLMASRWWLGGGFLLTNALCLGIVIFALKFPNYPLLANPLARWIGRHSYGIYLYHLPIFLVFDSWLHTHNFFFTLLVNLLRVGLTFLLAGLSYRFVEQPLLRLGNRRRMRQMA